MASSRVCNYIQILGTDATGAQFSLQRGLWVGQSQPGGVCTDYDEKIVINRRWTSARAMGILAHIFGVALVAGSVAILAPKVQKGCLKKKRKRRGLRIFAKSTLQAIAFKACLFQGLTLLFLTSSACTSMVSQDFVPGACLISQGGKLAISATVLWFFSAFAVNHAVTTIIAQSSEETPAKIMGEDRNSEQPMPRRQEEV